MTMIARTCEGCAEKVPNRFRTVLNLFLCEGCFRLWRITGEVPTPEPLGGGRWRDDHSETGVEVSH